MERGKNKKAGDRPLDCESEITMAAHEKRMEFAPFLRPDEMANANKRQSARGDRQPLGAQGKEDSGCRRKKGVVRALRRNLAMCLGGKSKKKCRAAEIISRKKEKKRGKYRFQTMKKKNGVRQVGQESRPQSSRPERGKVDIFRGR